MAAIRASGGRCGARSCRPAGAQLLLSARCSVRCSASPAAGFGEATLAGAGAATARQPHLPPALRAPSKPVGPPASVVYGQSVLQKVLGPKPLEVELLDLSPLDAQKLLTARVKAARTLRDFAEILAAGGVLVDSICLSALLVRMPKAALGLRTAGSGVDAATERRELLAALMPQVLSLLRLRLREFDAQGLVSAMVGLAKLTTDVPVQVDSSFRLILAYLQPRLGSLGPRALSNLVWACATAGVQPCGSWLSALYASVERQVDAFTSQDLANTLWGLAKFDLMPEEWLMDQLVAACLKQQQHHHQQLQQQQQAPPAAAPSSSSSSPASPQQQQPAAAARAAAGEDAAAVLTCLARYSSAYSYRLPEGWLASFLAALQPGLRGFRPEALVSIVHSVVCLNHMPARPFMVSLYGALKERLAADPRLAPSDYSRLLWSLSRVDFRPPRSWLAAFMEASAPLLPQLRPRALAEAVWALAVWDAKPTPRWLEAFFRASAARMAEFRPQQLAVTLSALAKLGCRAPTCTWLAPALAVFCAQLGDAKSHDLLAFLEAVPDVADDRLMLSQHQRALQLLADTAASKFELYDCVGHARLVGALARATLNPGAAWLARQQASLARCFRAESMDSTTAAGLVQAYHEWDADVDAELAAELEGVLL